MKILIDARLSGISNRGIGRYTVEYLKNLSKLKLTHEYVILTRGTVKEEFGNNFKLISTKHHPYSLFGQFEILNFLKQQKPDIFHSMFPILPLFISIPSIITVHDLIQLKLNLSATQRNKIIYMFKYVIFKKLFDRSINHSTFIVVPSRYVANDLEKTYHLTENKLLVAYEGCIDIKEKAGLDAITIDKPYFLVVGSVYPHKNVELAISAIQKLKFLHNNIAKLIIVAPNDYFLRRIKQLTNLQVSGDYISFYNAVEDNKLIGLYTKAKALVFPSKEEGFGLPGIEAMNLGTLVLASNIPVFHEVYEDNAIYFDSQDSDDLAKKMENVLDMRKSDRERFIAHNKKFVKKYSWSKMTSEISSLYNHIDIEK